MPYIKNADLPPAVKNSLPAAAQTIFRKAWMAANKEYKDEKKAFKTAWAAVTKAGYEKGEDGKWSKKDKSMSDSFNATATIIQDATEEDPNKPVKIRCQGTIGNVINDNQRLYPVDVLRPAVLDANQRASVEPLVAQSPHPENKYNKKGEFFFDVKIENNVAKESNIIMDDQNRVFFDAEIIPTAKGKDIIANVKAGVPVPVSMRATGQTVKRNYDGAMVDVATSMKILAFDFVGSPATSGSGTLKVLTDSQIAEIMEDDPNDVLLVDGVTHTDPVCPDCLVELESQDPDGDGDEDFFVCPECDAVFVMERSHQIEQHAHETLHKIHPDDYDKYEHARNYMRTKKTMTDSRVGKGDDINVTPEQVQAMLDAQKANIKNEVKTELEAQYKPIVDTVTAQQTAEQKAAAEAKAKADAKAFLDGKVTELQGKMKSAQIKFITDAVQDAETQQIAEAKFDVALKAMNDQTLGQYFNSIGFTGAPGPEGKIYAEPASHEKPWKGFVDKMIEYNDRYAASLGHQPKTGLRKFNEPIIDKLIDHFLVGRATNSYEHLVDSKQYASYIASHRREAYGMFIDSLKGVQPIMDGLESFETMVAVSDSVSMTTGNVFNQPTILTAVLVQAFQECEALQFLWNDVFMGKEWRIPVETFTSAATPDPLTGNYDIFIPEGQGIPESAVNLGYLFFQAAWRKNAISISDEVMHELMTGPVHYDAIARAVYHIGFDHRRKIDNASYDEMLRISDEYLPVAVTNEVPSSPSTSVVAVSDGSNVAYTYNLTGGGGSQFTGLAGRIPVVIPRVKSYLDQNGQVQSSTINPVSITVGGVALTLGYVIQNANGTHSVVGSGAGAAFDFENGIVYFTSAAGLHPTASTPVLPSISYSAATNLDYFCISTITPTGTLPAYYYNGLLNQLSDTAALMGSSPRFKEPNLAIFNRNAATYVENAQIFYKLAQPEGTKLIADGTYFGSRAGMNLAKVNATRMPNQRILLTQKGATRYGIQTPYQIKGPYPKYDSNNNIIAAELFRGEENSVLCTPQVQDQSGNVLNPVSRTIKLY